MQLTISSFAEREFSHRIPNVLELDVDWNSSRKRKYTGRLAVVHRGHAVVFEVCIVVDGNGGVCLASVHLYDGVVVDHRRIAAVFTVSAAGKARFLRLKRRHFKLFFTHCRLYVNRGDSRDVSRQMLRTRFGARSTRLHSI